MITSFKIFENNITPKYSKGDYVYSIYDFGFGNLIPDTKYKIYDIIFKNPKITPNIEIKNDNYLPHYEYALEGEFGWFGPFKEKYLLSEGEYNANKYNL